MIALSEETIFQVARQIARPEIRRLYLDQVCGPDAGLEARLEALLRAYDEEKSFLEQPAVSAATTLHEVVPLTSSSDQAATESEEAPGAVIGSYKLLERIGEGGMGVVWMAEQQQPVRRRVALKLVKRGMDSRQVLARFEAERQALALMDHPNIAKILDAGAANDRPYFVMELVKGIPLTRYCDDNRLPVRERLGLFADVCQAVQHAHQKGVIHRDLKPSNVMVAPYDGRPVVKVIDFGVAKAAGEPLTERTMFTGFGAIVGTPEYMSPEQAELNNRDVDTRSDVYSLGVMLYELLTGTTPLDGKRLKGTALLELLRLVREQEPPRPSMRLSGSKDTLPSISARRQTEPVRLTRLVRGDLDSIVMKALEKDRNRRYETASGFADDVRRYLSDEPVQACTPSVGYRVRKLARRHKGPVLAGLALAALLVLGTIGTSIGLAWALHAERTATLASRAEAGQRRDAETQRDTAQRRLYVADMQRALRAWETANISRLQEILENHRPQPGQRDLRGWEWYYLQGLCHRALVTIQGRVGSGACLAQSPDGRLVARADVSRTITVWNMSTGKKRYSLRAPDGSEAIHNLAWSQAGHRLASAGHARISVWDLASRQVQQTFQHTDLPGIFVHSLAWSPDGKRLASAANDTLKVWDVATGKPSLTLQDKSRTWSPGFALAWSPDGKWLASASNSAQGPGQGGSHLFPIKIWNTADGREVASLSAKTPTFWASLAWSADGKRLAGVSGYYEGNPEGHVKVWDVNSWKETLTLPGSSCVAWSPDGRRLAAASAAEMREIKLWDAASGEEILTLRGHTERVLWLAWSPDARTIRSAGAEGTIRVWDATRAQQYVALRGHKGRVTTLGWSAGGGSLASGSADGTIKIWHPDTLKEVKTIPTGAGNVRMVAWAADGRQLGAALDRGFKIWNVDTGNEILAHNPPPIRYQDPANKGGGGEHWFSVTAVAWSPDSRRLVTMNADGTLQVWDATVWKVIASLRGHGNALRQIAWSPDGKWLAAAGGGTIELWDPATWKEARPLAGHPAEITSLVWSADGKRLASASAKGAIKVWEPSRETEIMTFRGHGATVTALAWSPEGDRLASASADRTVKLWDLATGHEILSLTEETEAVAWRPNGRQIATGDKNGNVKLWDATSGYSVPVGISRADNPARRQGTGRTAYNLGAVLVDLGRHAEAEKALERALTVQGRLVAEFPDVFQYRQELGKSHGMLGLLREQTGRYPAAEQSYRQALALQEQLNTEDPGSGLTEMAITHYRLARVKRARHLVFEALEEWRLAVKAFGQLELAWDDHFRNDLAWFLATVPEAQPGDADQAVTVIRQALGRWPRDGNYLNTLGVCQYRAGRWKEAVASLEKSIQIRQGGDGNDWFFLAMAHWRLGNKDEARKWYDRAVEWMRKKAPGNDELGRFRLEASELLGIRKNPGIQDN